MAPGHAPSRFNPDAKTPIRDAIRKGKAAKPTECRKVVNIQEAEAPFITDYEVCPTRVLDGDLWVPALERFGHAPRLAVTGVGLASAAH